MGMLSLSTDTLPHRRTWRSPWGCRSWTPAMGLYCPSTTPTPMLSTFAARYGLTVTPPSPVPPSQPVNPSNAMSPG